MDSILNPFWIRIFLFFSYSFGIETINTFIYSRSSLKNHTRFQTEMGKIHTLFSDQKGVKPLPFWATHIPIWLILGTTPAPSRDRLFQECNQKGAKQKTRLSKHFVESRTHETSISIFIGAELRWFSRMKKYMSCCLRFSSRSPARSVVISIQIYIIFFFCCHLENIPENKVPKYKTYSRKLF